MKNVSIIRVIILGVLVPLGTVVYAAYRTECDPNAAGLSLMGYALGLVFWAVVSDYLASSNKKEQDTVEHYLTMFEDVLDKWADEIIEDPPTDNCKARHKLDAMRRVMNTYQLQMLIHPQHARQIDHALLRVLDRYKRII